MAVSLAPETSFAPEVARTLPSAAGVLGAVERHAMVRRVAIAVLSCAAVAFAIAYVAQEQPAYFWDWTAYFDRYRAYGAQFATGGTGWLATLAGTVAHDNYNVAVLTPLLPTYVLLGDGRDAYIATIIALYLLPAAWLAAQLAARVQPGHATPTQKSTPEPATPTWLFAAALLFWPLWIAALRGMPDVAGLVPLGAATLLVIETRYLTRASLLQGAALGVLVWLSFLLRRWYAYADVALETWCLAFGIATSLASDTRPAQLRRVLAAHAVNLCTLVALLLAYQAPLVETILHTSYADLYAGYQKPLAETAAAFLAQSGLALLAATALGVLRALRERNAAVLFLVVLPITTAVLFLRTQAPGVQHMLPFFFWLFPVAIYGATWGWTRAPAGVGRRAAIVVVLLAGFAAVLVPAVARLPALAAPILPFASYPPLRLEDPLAYGRLIAGLEARLAGPGDRVAVFASSPHLSGSLLRSLEPRLGAALVDVADVDARDGLRLEPFAARLAVVTAVPALHLPAAAQRVVAIPAAMIVAGTGPGAAYRRVAGPYRLDGGLEAFIYARDRPFDTRDAESIVRAMQAAYPTWRRSGAVVR